jgi:hypothetical protein
MRVPGRSQRLLGQVYPGVETGEALLDVDVAVGDHRAIRVVQSEALLQGEEVLGAVVAVEGPGDLLAAAAHAGVLQGGEPHRVAFPVEDGAEDPHPGGAGDVADHLVELDVHLGQRLLHALDVRGAVADQGVALAQVAAQHAGLIIGAEGAREQAEGVELLEPLAVLHVALAAGTVLTWRALTSFTSNPRVSRIWKRGIQYTPVDSMATVSMPHCSSHSASRSRSAVKQSKRRTGCGSRSSGTAT